MTDPYHKLKPGPSTPLDEMCSCSGNPPIKLMSALGPNPIHCMVCHGEVAPESIPLSPELAERVAAWNSVEDSLLRLWLDSDAYEMWAQGELENPDSPINRRGLDLRAELNSVRRCYYWIDLKGVPPLCPICGGPLVSSEADRLGQLVCDLCSIVGTINASDGIS